MNNKLKYIFCILAYSCSGKDSIARGVVNNNPKVKFLVSHTTRPMRENEEDGREYYFINTDKFLKMQEKNKFIESRVYHTKVEKDGGIGDDTWYYGLSKKEVEGNEYGLFIVDANGFKELRKYYGRGVVIPIYISTDEKELKDRYLQRGGLEEEFERRLKDDKEKFFDFRLKMVYPTVKNNDGDLDNAVEEVESIINSYIKECEVIKCKKKK